MDNHTKIKKLRIKILNNMKKCQVKPLKILFPNLSEAEFNQIPATPGFHVIWTKDKIQYNFASITIEGVINQVLKLEQAKIKKRNYVSRNDGPIMPQNGAI